MCDEASEIEIRFTRKRESCLINPDSHFRNREPTLSSCWIDRILALCAALKITPHRKTSIRGLVFQKLANLLLLLLSKLLSNIKINVVSSRLNASKTVKRRNFSGREKAKILAANSTARWSQERGKEVNEGG